jgi:hypothetical protein
MNDISVTTFGERIQLKARELSRVRPQAITKDDIKIELKSILEIAGGVEVLARAWKDGKPVGFGKDGSIETERFRVTNPPILVPDPNGKIERVTEEDGVKTITRYRKDPKSAIFEVISQTVRMNGKIGNVQPGKIGKTTYVFYPAAGANSPCDGYSVRAVSAENWATILAGTGTGTSVTYGAGYLCYLHASFSSARWKDLRRGFFFFDTSSLDGIDIDSATLTFVISSNQDQLSMSAAIVSVSTGSASSLANGDHNIGNFGTTKFCNDISCTSTGTIDNALNASGIAHINKTGITKFGALSVNELNNSSPTWANQQRSHITVTAADADGTTNDPKLTVSTVSTGATVRLLALTGCGT